MFLAVSTIPIGIIGGTQGLSASMMFIGLIFLVTFIISLILSFIITRPLEKITKNIDEISKGKLDVNLEYSEIKEINKLTESLNRVMASLKLAIHKVGVKKGEIFEDAVKAKQAFEKKQEDLLNSINGWAWEIDKNMTYTYCSSKMSDILGYNYDGIIGRNYYDLLPLEESKKVKQVFEKSAKDKKQIKNVEIYNISNNGKQICVLTNGTPYYDEDGNLLGFRGVNTDITRIKEAEVKIKDLNTKLSDLKAEITNLLNEREKKKSKIGIDTKIGKKNLDEIWSEHEFDSVFIFDENANILDCNENMYKRLGYSKSEILSLNMSDIDALETKDDLLDKIKKAKKDGALSFKTIHKRKDGSAILVHENIQYDKDNDSFKCIIREDYSDKKSS